MIKDGNMEIMEYADDGEVPEIEGLMHSGEMPDIYGIHGSIPNNFPTIEFNSVSEFQNYISKLEQSDDPSHQSMAKLLRNHLSGIDAPADTNISISISMPGLPD